MQDVNAARDLLAGLQRGGGVDREDINAMRAARIKRMQELKDYVVNDLQQRVNSSAFLKYFEDVFGEKFTGEFIVKPSDHYVQVWANLKIRNHDATKYFEMDLHPDVLGMMDAPISLGSTSLDSIPYSVTVDGFTFTDNRKTKLYSKSWVKTSTASKFTDPATVFPRAKITKDVSRKFSKRDMLAGLTATPGVEWSSDRSTVFIPLAEDGKCVAARRSTMMGTAAWDLEGTFTRAKYSIKRDPDSVSKYLPEDEITLKVFKSFSKLTAAEAIAFIRRLKEPV